VAKKFVPRGKYYRLNQFIQAREVRVVDEKGKQVGIMSLPDALKHAQAKGFDLVEIAPKAQPPVCKAIDFKKFKFLEAKKEQEEKKKTKKIELKEIQFSPFIAENDFNVRLERIRKFLKDGDKVRVVVRFRGREIAKKEFGYKLFEKTIDKLSDISRIEVEPRFLGNRLEMLLSPLKGDKSGQKKDENQKVNQKKT